MLDLISVIIPVYNVEKYIAACIDSILSQTYKNVEIVIVDDGSTDDTGLICDKYAKEYQCIRVVHQNNAGVALARNKGLDIFNGEWVFFVDGDDRILPNALQLAHKYALETGCKVVDFNYTRIFNGKAINKGGVYRENSIESSCLCLKNTLLYGRALICPKLYHRTILGQYRFNDKLKIGEDILFNIQLYLDNEISVAHNTTPIYLYLLREGSAMQNSHTHLEYNILNEVMSHCLSSYTEYQTELKLFCCINLYFKSIKERKPIDKVSYKKYFSSLLFKECLIKDLAIKFKILFVAFKLNRHIGNIILSLRYSFFAVH